MSFSIAMGTTAGVHVGHSYIRSVLEDPGNSTLSKVPHLPSSRSLWVVSLVCCRVRTTLFGPFQSLGETSLHLT